jgi:hypothetical protein
MIASEGSTLNASDRRAEAGDISSKYFSPSDHRMKGCWEIGGWIHLVRLRKTLRKIPLPLVMIF